LTTPQHRPLTYQIKMN